jgi:replicative DNA helicase
LLGEPSGGLVDVDLDCAAAVRLAPVFLPATGAVFGRLSAPASHYLYIADGATTARFADPTVSDGERGMLLELRSTGCQTLLPPSTHPVGERVAWEPAHDGDPVKVDATDLARRVRHLAAAALLARHWTGVRHFAAGALAGGLLRAGWPPEQVTAFVRAVAEAADDGEVADRLRMVTDTAANLAAGQPVTGWPTLAQHLGGQVVDRLRDWLDGGATEAGDSEAEWEPPLPLGVVRDLPAFPVEALPGWLAAYVDAVAEATQTPADLAGLLALAVLGAAAGRLVEVEARPGWREPVNVFTVVALPPGTRKSAVFRAMAGPLVERERDLIDRARQPLADAAGRKRIAEGAAKAAEAKAATAKATGKPDADGLAEAALQAAAEAALIAVPQAPRLIADDATVEALASLLAEQGGRIAVLSPEGGIFDLLAGRYSPSNMPNLDVFLKGHAGDDLRVDRKGRDPEYVERPALTAGLAVQPAVLRGLAARPGFRGRGLLARWLYALPVSTVGHRQVDAAPVPAMVAKTYGATQRELADDLAVAADKAGGTSTLRLDDAAHGRLLAFMDELEPRLAAGADLGHLADWAGKLAGAVVRVAGLLHVADRVRAATIPAATVDRATRIAAYLLPHALAAFDEMGADPRTEDAGYVLERIRANGWDRFTRRDLHRVTRSRFAVPADLDPVLALLAEHGYVRPVEQPTRSPKGGRPPSPAYEVNPLPW